MGDETDVLMDLALDAELKEEMEEKPKNIIKYLVKNELWMMCNGKTIEISKMHLGHLKNAINMLYKKGYVSRDILEFYLTCVPPNGDMAQDSFRNEQNAVLDRTPHPLLGLLEAELKHRKVQYIAPGINKIKRR